MKSAVPDGECYDYMSVRIADEVKWYLTLIAMPYRPDI